MAEQAIEVLDRLEDGSDALAGCFSARDYHSGQFSQLYRLGSSGMVSDLYWLRVELLDAIEIAETSDEDGSLEDAENMRALVAWVDSLPESEVYGA